MSHCSCACPAWNWEHADKLNEHRHQNPSPAGQPVQPPLRALTHLVVCTLGLQTVVLCSDDLYEGAVEGVGSLSRRKTPVSHPDPDKACTVRHSHVLPAGVSCAA
ncbi:hypothetical protein K402DRAFT_7099 [Aulographum hederae CBS 113979]|uniref:Uncharacterized protein n=1 Tax=Aulographum hederae CBS 113979 TaxID=1176131 RepID=A0A6G1HH39_9PEZI|nr:hypothetical protein K402DRAFT_7099 [Aulographum hederae CBS 113979]